MGFNGTYYYVSWSLKGVLCSSEGEGEVISIEFLIIIPMSFFVFEGGGTAIGVARCQRQNIQSRGANLKVGGGGQSFLLILALQKHAGHDTITCISCLEYNWKLALQVQE